MSAIPYAIPQARYAGSRAAYAGRPITANPHKDCPDRGPAWIEGWQAKHADLPL
jgi:hypothetical protein